MRTLQLNYDAESVAISWANAVAVLETLSFALSLSLRLLSCQRHTFHDINMEQLKLERRKPVPSHSLTHTHIRNTLLPNKQNNRQLDVDHNSRSARENFF